MGSFNIDSAGRRSLGLVMDACTGLASPLGTGCDVSNRDPLAAATKSILRIAGAAGIYFAFSMTGGFVLGPLRELALVPMFGRSVGALIEAGLMLPAIFAAAWGALRICKVSSRSRDRALVGSLSLFLVLTAEIALSPLIWGSVADWIATFTSTTLLVTVVLWTAQSCAPLIVSRGA